MTDDFTNKKRMILILSFAGALSDLALSLQRARQGLDRALNDEDEDRVIAASEDEQDGLGLQEIEVNDLCELDLLDVFMERAFPDAGIHVLTLSPHDMHDDFLFPKFKFHEVQPSFPKPWEKDVKAHEYRSKIAQRQYKLNMR